MQTLLTENCCMSNHPCSKLTVSHLGHVKCLVFNSGSVQSRRVIAQPDRPKKSQNKQKKPNKNKCLEHEASPIRLIDHRFFESIQSWGQIMLRKIKSYAVGQNVWMVWPQVFISPERLISPWLRHSCNHHLFTGVCPSTQPFQPKLYSKPCCYVAMLTLACD